MPSRRLPLVVAFSAAVSSGPAPALAQGPEPAAIVKSIYAKRDPYGGATSLQMRAPHRRALWKRSDDATPAGDEPVPGFDIASNSNDREVARAEVTVERRDGKRATVAAKLFNKGPGIKVPASDDIVRYDLVRENGRWAIDDVRSTIDGKAWSLKALLRERLKQVPGVTPRPPAARALQSRRPSPAR